MKYLIGLLSVVLIIIGLVIFAHFKKEKLLKAAEAAGVQKYLSPDDKAKKMAEAIKK